MKTKLKDLVLRLLKAHRVMTIATNRPDGWPQATMVGYVNDGLMLYCFVVRDSQKHLNVLCDPRISVAIGSDAKAPLDIKGLSLAGTARVVEDRAEWNRVTALRLARYPEYAALPPPVFRGDALARIAPQPPTAQVVLLRIEPEIISVVDYSQGFGHSDLIAVAGREVERYVQTARHEWHGAARAGEGGMGESEAGRDGEPQGRGRAAARGVKCPGNRTHPIGSPNSCGRAGTLAGRTLHRDTALLELQRMHPDQRPHVQI